MKIFQEIINIFRKIASLGPGYDPIMFILYIFYRKPKISYRYLESIIPKDLNDRTLKEILRALDIKIEKIDDPEDTVALIDIGGVGWNIIENIRKLQESLKNIKIPEEMRVELFSKYLCPSISIPSVLINYTALRALGESLSSINKKLSEEVVGNMVKMFRVALTEDRYVFDESEVFNGNVAKELKEYALDLTPLLEDLSEISSITYLKDAKIFILDRESIENIKMAQTNCEPKLKEFNLKEVEIWLRQLKQL